MENLITYDQIEAITGLARHTIIRRIKEKNITVHKYVYGQGHPKNAITKEDYEIVKSMGRKEYDMTNRESEVKTTNKFSVSSKCGSSKENIEHGLYMRISPYWTLNCQQRTAV